MSHVTRHTSQFLLGRTSRRALPAESDAAGERVGSHPKPALATISESGTYGCNHAIVGRARGLGGRRVDGGNAGGTIQARDARR